MIKILSHTGVGENIRGTILGAIDAFAKNGDMRNEEIARKGRWEIEQGLAALRGQRPGATQQYTAYPQQSAGAATVGDPIQHNNRFGAENELGVSQTQHGPGQGPGVGGLGDKGAYHHRDDAVTDLNAQPGQHGHRAGQLSSADQKRMPSYDRNDKFDASQGGGGRV